MAQQTISIPWQTGGGNIVVEYSGEGNGTLSVHSDGENPLYTERQQTITIATSKGTPARAIAIIVRQLPKTGSFVTLEQGGYVLLEDGGKIKLEDSE